MNPELLAKVANRSRQLGESHGDSLPLYKVKVSSTQEPPIVSQKPSKERITAALAGTVYEIPNCKSGSMKNSTTCNAITTSKCGSSSSRKVNFPNIIIGYPDDLGYEKTMTQWYEAAILYPDADIDEIYIQIRKSGCTISDSPY